MTTEVCDALKKIKEIVSNEARWGIGYYAVNAKGEEVDPLGDDGVRFCLVGAVYHTTKDYYSSASFKVRGMLLDAARQLEPQCVALAILNDHYGQKAVVKVCELAIELAKEAKYEYHH